MSTTFAEIRKNFLFKKNPFKLKRINRWAKIHQLPGLEPEIHVYDWQGEAFISIFSDDTMQFLSTAPSIAVAQLINKLIGQSISFYASKSIKTNREYIINDARYPYIKGMFISLITGIPLDQHPISSIHLDQKLLKHITAQLNELDDIIWPIIHICNLVPRNRNRHDGRYSLPTMTDTAQAWINGDREPEIINKMVTHILHIHPVYHSPIEFTREDCEKNLMRFKARIRKPLYIQMKKEN